MFINLKALVFSWTFFKSLLRLNLNLFANRDFALLSLAPNSNGMGVVGCPGKLVLAVVRGGGSSPSALPKPRSLSSSNLSNLESAKSLKRNMRVLTKFHFSMVPFQSFFCLKYDLFCSKSPFSISSEVASFLIKICLQKLPMFQFLL